VDDLNDLELDISEDDILAHFGKKGMKWGIRRTQTPALIRENRSKGLGPNQLRSESKRIAEAGGGVRGTIRVRKEMIDSGELSKTDARKGTARFGRNVAAALLAGGLAGVTIAGLTKRKGHDYSRLGESKVLNSLANKFLLGE